MTQLTKHIRPLERWEVELIETTSPAKVGMHVTVNGIRGVIQRIQAIRGISQPCFDVSTKEEGLLTDIPLDAFE